MKKLTRLISILTTFVCLTGFGQINLEHSYFTKQKQFYVTDIGNNNYKYVTMDSVSVNIYNLNHTPYLINHVPPLPLWKPPFYYEVIYITNSLFDCDSTTLEYVITSGPYPQGGFYIYRTNGTLLFKRDSITGPYCYGCGDGSITIRPIQNTPNGTKLLLFSNDSTWVYSLCGALPLLIDENALTATYVKVFPNPTTGIINFDIAPPSNKEKFKLTIYNSAFQVVHQSNSNARNYQIDLNNNSLPAGTYLFDLRTDNKVFQTGKFVISK